MAEPQLDVSRSQSHPSPLMASNAATINNPADLDDDDDEVSNIKAKHTHTHTNGSNRSLPR